MKTTASLRPLISLLPPAHRKKARIILFIFTLIFGSGSVLFLQGKVISVADGDTLTLLQSPATSTKVRLYGIDCPEMQQAYGQEAARVTEDLVLWQPITMQVQDTDRYNRSVAIVTLQDGTILNEYLVANGHAWVYRQYCKTLQCQKWIALEDNAKKEGKGLWAHKKPQPPWQWRAKKNNQ